MRPFYLYGPPASGKSTLGRLLARRFAVPFGDLDEIIEREAGRSVPAIFASEGEAGFRAREKAALAACDIPGVVALGGGALLAPENDALVRARGRLLFLDVQEAELRRRMAAESDRRPLGEGVLAARQAHYAAYDARLRAHFPLDMGGMPSDIFVGGGLLAAVGDFAQLARLGGKCVAVADANTARPYGERVCRALETAGIPATLHVVPAGEATKTMSTVMDIWRAFLEAGLGRCDFAVAVGGGVVGDMTGFAAATWMRGMPWINMPTSLLAMVDASTGGKTGCDLPQGKNLVGAFHAPRLVVIDEEVLETLPPRERRAGRAEWIKHDILSGRRASCVAETLAVKVRIVAEDPFEKGVRAKLNAGHTVAHALEIATQFALSHGEAVAIGMVEEARLAVRLGLAPAHWPDEVAALYAAEGLPVSLPPGMTFEQLAATMCKDKKQTRARCIRFALPCAMGDVRLVPVAL